jgi:hypothetical protein
LAGFQVATYGRFWVATEAKAAGKKIVKAALSEMLASRLLLGV